jgi:hypothetical protein
MQQNIDMGYKNRFIVFLLFSSIVLTAQTGIGTTTPVNKLQVETTLADPASSGALANGNLRLSASSGSHVLDFGLSSSSTYSWLQSRSRSNYTTNFNLILNPNGGNVGIGTTSPGDPLVVGSFAIHDGGNKVIGFGYSPGVGKNLLTGFPAEIRLDPANGSLSLGTSATSFTSGTTPTLTARMVITSQGNVGIGTTTPTTKLYVNGDITANSVAGTSDSRFKTNIRPVTHALDKVKALQGVYFNWNQKAFPEKEFGAQDQLGFIAQEVEKIVPEIVLKDKTKEEYRSVKYDKLVALLVEAVKEQQKQIEKLQLKVKEMAKTRKK